MTMTQQASDRSRRTRVLGAIAISIVVLLLTVSFKLDALSALTHRGGTHLSADFTDASAIAPGDPVRIAGIAVGKVDSVRVVAGHARVGLTVNGAPRLGQGTTATLSLDTLLGQHSLVLLPAGSSSLSSGATIPLSRTSTPFGVTDALLGTAKALAPINSAELARALATVANALDPAAPDVRTAVTGISSLSKAVGDREDQVRQLFASTAEISATLAGRSTQVSRLLRNSGLVLTTLDRRRHVLRDILTDTGRLGTTVTRILSENQGKLTPALTHLHRVLGVLRAHQADLDEALRLLGPYARYFSNLSGNGHWFDGYISGLLPIDLSGSAK